MIILSDCAYHLSPFSYYKVKGKKKSANQIFPQAADPLPPPLRVAKTGRNHLNKEFTPPPPSPLG